MSDLRVAWQQDLATVSERLRRLVPFSWEGSFKVYDKDSRIIADCPSEEAARAASRLLLGG